MGDELQDGLGLETGYHQVLHPTGDRLHLRLGVDTADESAEDEEFTLHRA